MFKKHKRLPYLPAMLFAIVIVTYFIGRYFAIDYDAQSRAKNQLQKTLVENFLNWQPPQYSADFPNPYHDEIISRGAEIVPLLIKSQKTNKIASSTVVQTVGEIGSPEAFEFLLDAYKIETQPDTAISIGSCWRASSINKVFNSLDKTDRDKLLQTILGEKWDSLKNKNEGEIKKYITDNMSEIIENCKQRSKPVLG